MELRVLQYFLMVAREQNITRAAEALHITQPTLSRQLMQLEDEFGKTLFVRGKGKIALTSEGMLLKKRAEELVALAAKTEQEMKESNEHVAGRIFIGSGETRQFHELSRIIKQFHEQYPAVTFELFSAHADDIKERINSGLLDIGLLLEPVDISDYEFLRLPDKDCWGVVLPKADPLAEKAVITAEDLRGKTIIASKRPKVHNEIENWFQDVYESVQEVASINLVNNAAMMVEDGLGYLITLQHLIAEYPENPICFRPLSPSLETGCVLVWKKHQLFSPAAAAFITCLKHAFQAYGKIEKEY
ncbi:LysR family transcriptional regulator [Erysipelotrichaceae bacterium AF15-26LB]|nr:LysR substrate binding domain protein [Erysipelotrichaceae bacterium 3_1_53]MCR0348522.1 LysR family transcriptional regulator [[Clostridium] innocuum]RJV88416.1 LysR family transcriptional regulator [Erysipelotrichaceae bacterium AF19-24AC]RJV90268.1 LysR family transcriptional regulator [Erysipelotrichaceae bacterium AF15-26LB]